MAVETTTLKLRNNNNNKICFNVFQSKKDTVPHHFVVWIIFTVLSVNRYKSALEKNVFFIDKLSTDQQIWWNLVCYFLLLASIAARRVNNMFNVVVNDFDNVWSSQLSCSLMLWLFFENVLLIVFLLFAAADVDVTITSFFSLEETRRE